MGRADRLYDRKTQAGATRITGTRSIDAKKAVEDQWQRLPGYANAIVGHFHDGVFSSDIHPQFDAAAARRVFDGIIEEIDGDLLQARVIPFDHDSSSCIA